MSWYKKAQVNSPMPKRLLGKTGYKVSTFSLGGQGALENQGGKKNCINIIRRAYELGVNYFDTSPIYGPSENYYGEALKDIREDIFLASKTDKRDKSGSLKEIEKSLKRLNTDYLDLWQIHHLDSLKEVNQVAGKNGALAALIEMQEQGVVKWLGITGHEDPKILTEIMNRYDFDTVLCPVNACDMNMDKPFISTVIKKANEKNMGIIGMKIFSQGYIFHPDGLKNISDPILYSLSQPISTIIVGCDSIKQLEENISTAKSFSSLNKKEQKEIEEKTKSYKKRACFFRKEYGGYDSKNELNPPYKI